MKSLWDQKARFYPGLRKIFPFNFILARELQNLAQLISQIPAPNRSLDLATGPGTVLELLSPVNGIVAIDRSQTMLKKAARYGKVKFIRADGRALPFRRNSFELVIVAGFLEYHKNWERLLNEIAAVLKSGGFAIITYSPLNLLNIFRFLFGHRIFFKTETEIENLVNRTEFTCLESMKSLIQKQHLLKFQRTE